MRFKKYKIEDIAKIVGGGTPSTKIKEYYGGEIPWLTPKDLSGYNQRYIARGERNITTLGLQNSSAKLLPKNTVMLSSRAPIGYLAISMNEIATSQGFKNIICDEKKIIPEYMYYLLTTKIDELESISSGSTFKEISGKTLKKFEVDIPELEVQYSTVKKLSAFDSKIELNNQMIDTLEEIASTLFKRWFVDFEFPDENGNPYKSSGGKMIDSELGEIPDGWEIKRLSEIANYKNGLAMQKFRPLENEDSLPVLKIKELNQGYTDQNSDRCSIDINEDVKVYDGDIIFSWSGTLIVDIWTGGNAGLNQHLFKVTSEKYSKWFYYLWTKFYLNKFIAIAKDKATTMGHIKRQHLNESLVCVPKDFELLNQTFEGIINKVENLGKSNRDLEQMRDLLLPKLLSGEIKV